MSRSSFVTTPSTSKAPGREPKRRPGVLPRSSDERLEHVAQRWPERLWIVRHGESAGNVARNAAMAAGLAEIDIALRDADVPLSGLGEQQSRALGRWFAAMPSDERPNVVLVSPYRRAQQTAQAV